MSSEKANAPATALPVAGASATTHVQTEAAPLTAGGGGTIVEVDVSKDTPTRHGTPSAS